MAEAGKVAGIPLRIFGAAAIYQHCPKYAHLFGAMGRRVGDIDLASYDKHSAAIARLMGGLGYDEDLTMTAFGGGRLIFRRKADGLHCDVFLGKLEMSHTITFEKRLELDYPTVPLADLFLAKMQIFKLNEKDVIDTIVLLREHGVGKGATEQLDADYVFNLCSKDWGLWRTVTGNLRTVSAFLSGSAPLTEPDRHDVSSKVSELLSGLDSVPKALAWRLRARVGESRKWYNEVEDLYR